MSALLLATPLLRWAVPAAAAHYDFYTLFYVLAFTLNLALLVWAGQRRGYPLRTWLVVLTCTTLSFILGTKLLALSGPDWQQLAQGHWPASEARTVLGGALAGTLTLLALRRPFGFSWHVFDTFTLPICAALVVQCVGCVLTGCCFGEPTAGDWGLTYPPDTLPYLVQAVRGQLPAGAAHSLPVHPTQLYSLLLCAGVGGVLLAVRRRVWPSGSRRLLHLGLLLVGRWLIEFWRDPAGEQVGAAVHVHAGFALKQVQWALLLLGPATLGLWAWKVRRAQRQPALAPERLPTQQPVRNLLAVAALLGLTAWLGPHALTLPEVVVIKTLLLAVLVLEGGALLLGVGAASQRRGQVALPLGLASLVFLLTSQVPAPPDSTAGRYLTFGLNTGQGKFDQDLQSTGGGCSGGGGAMHTMREAYYHRYVVRGGELAYNYKVSPDGARQAIGLRVQAGTQHVAFQELSPNSKFLTTGATGATRLPLLDINPYYEQDSPHRLHIGTDIGVGYRLGLHLGHLGYRPASAFDTVLRRQIVILPDFQFWLGRRDLLFTQADMGYDVGGINNFVYTWGLGSGFGSRRGAYLLAGWAQAGQHEGSQNMGFLRAAVPLVRTGLWLEPYGATNFGRLHQVSVRLQYRLPLKLR